MYPVNHVYLVTIAAFLNIFISIVIAHKFETKCPIGYEYTDKDDESICYKLKGPEAFEDVNRDCTGNLFTYELYRKLDVPSSPTEELIWSNYKSVYPGGPFNNWYYNANKVILNHIKYNESLGIDEELCVVIDKHNDLIATTCKKKYLRYCFVKPYKTYDLVDSEGCIPGYTRYWGPRYTCLKLYKNWTNLIDAKVTCEKEKGSLLHRGWRHAVSIKGFDEGWSIPLGVYNDSTRLVWDVAENNVTSIYDNIDITFEPDKIIALQDRRWKYVDESRLSHFICEHALPIEKTTLTLDFSKPNEISIVPADKLMNVHCYTDSITYNTSVMAIKASHLQIKSGYGYYWCRNNSGTELIESNRLFYPDPSTLEAKSLHKYAVKITISGHYQMSDIGNRYMKNISRKISDHIKTLTQYIKNTENGYDYLMNEGSKEKEKILLTYCKNSTFSPSDDNVLSSVIVKRLYQDRKTILFHADLKPDMSLAMPGAWDDLVVLHMRPIYFCFDYKTKLSGELGDSKINVDGKNYTCVGDHTEGVQWIMTADTRNDSEEYSTSMTIEPEPTTPKRKKHYKSDTSEESSEYDNLTTSSKLTRYPPTSTRKPSSSSPSEVPSTVTMPTTTTMPLPPEELVNEVVDNIAQLLADSETVSVENVQLAFDQVNPLLDLEDDLMIPTELLRLLDELGTRADLRGNQVDMAINPNVAVVMANAGPDYLVRGLRVSTRDDDEFNNETFQVLLDTPTSQLFSNESEAVISLPESVLSDNRRISFVVFRNDRAFHSSQPNYHALNSRVISVNIENITTFARGETIDIYFKPIYETVGRNISRQCVFYEFEQLENGSYSGDSDWSTNGCVLIKNNDDNMLDICRCTHLTHFAEILVSRTVFSEEHENALKIISIIGCILSIIGLVFIGLTAILFRSWRRDYSNKVWLQLCVAIFIMIVCFLIVAFVKFDHYDIWCMLTGVALHYSVLASFCWMLVAAVLSYRRLVLIFTRDLSHKLLKAAAFAWGTPFGIIGILLAVSRRAYETKFEEINPAGSFCYPSGTDLWLSVMMPIGLMLMVNWVLFGLIVRSVFCTSKRVSRHVGDTNEALRCASVSFLLIFLFGLPWIFGMLSSNIVMAYFFAFTAAFQGLVLFIFFVVGNKKTRDLWLNKLKLKLTRKVPVTSSTYTNRTVGAGNVNNNQVGSNTLEAKSNKPRSLSLHDNSSFS